MFASPPVLITAYNRPDKLSSLFSSLETAAPPLVFIHVDGPKEGDIEDGRLVEKTREVASELPWKAEVKTRFNDSNLGCRTGMNGALDWFFDSVEQGIVLEDDLIVGPSMYPFFAHGLREFQKSDVWMLSGNKHCSLQSFRRPSMSKVIGIWGWATWAEKWKSHDKALSFWPGFRESSKFMEIFPTRSVGEGFKSEIDAAYTNQIDTWDLGWLATIWKNGGYSVVPPVNLVSNQGFDARATHTKKANFESNLSIHMVSDRNLLKSPKRSKASDAFEFLMLKGKPEIRAVLRHMNKLTGRLLYTFYGNLFPIARG